LPIQRIVTSGEGGIANVHVVIIIDVPPIGMDDGRARPRKG
jgi:hypothetical protein